MHPHADFELLDRRVIGEGAGGTSGHEPRRASLEPDLLTALTDLLGRHTRSVERCWFCLWDGWGWIHGRGAILVSGDLSSEERQAIQRDWEAARHSTVPREALEGPRVRLPGRDYLLFEGPLDAAGELGEWTHWEGRSWFDPQTPNLWWPDDRSWCVATEIDLDSTYVGGSVALVEEILGDPRFEALKVRATDRREDTINNSS